MSNEIQQGLQDDLTTIEPDLMNMTRLFSLPDSVWDAPEYHFAASIEGGQYVIRFYGKTQAAQGVTDIPSDADARIQALHRRRALRRLCRQTLYDLLRKETGIHPPWGEHDGHSSDAPDVRGAERRHVDGGRAGAFGAPV